MLLRSKVLSVCKKVTNTKKTIDNFISHVANCKSPFTGFIGLLFIFLIQLSEPINIFWHFLLNEKVPKESRKSEAAFTLAFAPSPDFHAYPLFLLRRNSVYNCAQNNLYVKLHFPLCLFQFIINFTQSVKKLIAENC